MIGYFGLTHLGLVYALATAKKGNKVIAYSEDSKLIDSLSKNKVPFFEPHIKKELKNNKKNLKFSNNIKDLKKCKIIFFSYDVPTDTRNKSNFNFINKKLKFLLKNLNRSSELIILSQVKPGFTKKINWPKTKLYYMVETLIMGNAFKKAFSPERIIIGSYNKKINTRVKKFLLKFTKNIINTSYETAELTKISVNLMLISSITMTNVLSEICEKINGNWDEIKYSLQLDKRIGKYAYLRPGLGILSGNLQRDLENLNEISNKYNLNYPYSILKIIKKYSEIKKNWISNILKKLNMSKKTKIGLLGLTYKENITNLKNSPSISLIQQFKNHSFNVFDPKIKKKLKFKNVKEYNNSSEVINNSEIIIIATPWKEFKVLNFNSSKIKNIIDPYGIIKTYKNKKMNYYKMGFKDI